MNTVFLKKSVNVNSEATLYLTMLWGVLIRTGSTLVLIFFFFIAHLFQECFILLSWPSTWLHLSLVKFTGTTAFEDLRLQWEWHLNLTVKFLSLRQQLSGTLCCNYLCTASETGSTKVAGWKLTYYWFHKLDGSCHHPSPE